ncbi:hypothetical protein Zmor_027455 [Zophobas morio]|uniref:Uncharacterized protein n=1 Tax=Zophobas morio TaxID=2755281 RepID=A0AA38HQQ3_9CUCU|nr:hypothetical protein Zmor_027455 [Zophobas morio]
MQRRYLIPKGDNLPSCTIENLGLSGDKQVCGKRTLFRGIRFSTIWTIYSCRYPVSRSRYLRLYLDAETILRWSMSAKVPYSRSKAINESITRPCTNLHPFSWLSCTSSAYR